MSDDDKLSPRGKLGAARAMVLRNAPYFSSILLMLVPKESPGMGTIGCTKTGIMLYDPETVDKWSLPELTGALVHEVMHFLQDHFNRFKDKQHFIANLAGDLTINPAVKAMGFELPPEGMMPDLFGFPEKMTAEWYYEELKKQAKKLEGKEGKAGLGSGHCGSCAGNPLPNEPEGSSLGRTPAELSRGMKTTAEAIRQEHQRGRGDIPGELLRWADSQLTPPKVRWQDKLARKARQSYISKAGCTDYSYGRPSRRQGASLTNDPIKPTMIAYDPKVAVWVDTSGSMGNDELKRAMSEVAGVMRAVGASITFGAIDCAIHAVKQVGRWQDAISALKGGGGTDFRPVFEWLEKQRQRPDVLIFITDGCGPAPDAPPKGTAVIWLLIGKYKQIPATWGETIEVDD